MQFKGFLSQKIGKFPKQVVVELEPIPKIPPGHRPVDGRAKVWLMAEMP
jgi:hypothetical protein